MTQKSKNKTYDLSNKKVVENLIQEATEFKKIGF